MHFPSLLTCLTLFTSSVLAAPALAARAATITFNPGTPTSAPKAPYILKTRVRNAANPSKPVDKSKVKYNNLYLWAYHTGAGLNDAVVSNNKSIASPGFLNATAQQFKLGQYNYGFNFEIGTYSGWGEVQINAGVQTKGFSFTKQHGLVWGGKSGTEAASFGGWLGEY